jgi:hypothetical protein
MLRRLAPFALVVAAFGCNSDGEISKSDQDTLRNNMKRSLTAEEMAQMGKSAPQGAQAPNKKGG